MRIVLVTGKGGVGKTTTAINLGASLAVAEKRTLVVDIDPQGNATSGLGVTEKGSRATIYDVLIGNSSVGAAVIKEVHFPHLDVVPSTRDLVGAEIELVPAKGRESILRAALTSVRDSYDFILVDCPPSLGLLTLNTLTAADSVLIPIQCEFYALEGLSQLMSTLEAVRGNLNSRLNLGGLLLTMYDARTNLCQQVAQEVRSHFPETFEAVIPRSVRLSEAPSHGLPIGMYDARSSAAKAYGDLANEVIDKFVPAFKAKSAEAKR